MDDLTSLKVFLPRYRTFLDQQKSATLQKLRGDLERIRSRLPEFTEQAGEYVRRTAPQFNVYSILHLGRRETIVHTPMLEHLLNPQGSHEQGNLFLKTFFNVLSQAGAQSPSKSFDEFDWIPKKDVVTQFGNIDLVLRCQSQKYLMVIENKIDAVEQEDQLKRYSEWMMTQQGTYPRQELVFLTPEGSISRTAGNAKYCRVSYRRHVREWITNCIPQVQAPGVQEVIRQYLATVENF